MKKTYYNRILLMYSSVLFCLLVVMAGFYFFNRSAASQEKIEEQDRVLFSEYIRQEEGVFESLVTQAHYIQNMDSLAAYAFSSKDNYYSKMTQLHNNLSKCLWSKNTTYMVHKINDSLALTTLRSIPAATQLKSYGIEEDTYQEVLQSLVKSDRENGRFIFSEKGVLYLTTKTFVNNRMVISTFHFNATDSLIQEEKITAGFYVNDTEAVDLRTDPAQEPAEFASLWEDLKADRNRISSCHKDNKFMMYRYSQYADLIYYFQRDDVNQSLLWETLQLIPVLLLIFALSFFLIRHLSKRLYAPIDHLVDLFLDMEPDTENVKGEKEKQARDEIDYLAGQVSKIRTENRDLTERISEIQAQSRHKFLSALIQGAYDEDSLEEELSRYHLEWLDGINYIVYCTLQEEVSAGLTGEILSIVQEKIGERFQVLPFSGGDYSGYFILHTEDKENLKAMLSEIVTLIDTAFGVSARFFIGKKSKSAVNLQYSFMTIEKIETNRQQFPVSSVYDFSEIRNVPSQGTVYPVGTENKLLTAIQKGNYGEVKKTLAYIFREYLEWEFEDPGKRRQLAYAFVNTINRAVLQEGVESPSLSQNTQTLFDDLMNCGNAEEFEKRLSSVFEKICQLSGQKEQSQISNLKVQIEEYISENLSQDISLITISNHFHLTPNYMSSIFKDVMGENFKDYLSRCRFDKIVAYLKENPQASVNEAGAQAGIHNATTLARLFKKFADCSPGQYIEKLRQ